MRVSFSTPTHEPAQQNIYALLGQRARGHSLEHLAIEATVAGVACLALAITRPGWWALYLPLGVVASYGFWGLLDRATTAFSPSRRDARFARGALLSADWALVALGTAGVIAFFLALTRVAFEGWIH